MTRSLTLALAVTLAVACGCSEQGGREATVTVVSDSMETTTGDVVIIHVIPTHFAWWFSGGQALSWPDGDTDDPESDVGYFLYGKTHVGVSDSMTYREEKTVIPYEPQTDNAVVIGNLPTNYKVIQYKCAADKKYPIIFTFKKSQRAVFDDIVTRIDSIIADSVQEFITLECEETEYFVDHYTLHVLSVTFGSKP